MKPWEADPIVRKAAPWESDPLVSAPPTGAAQAAAPNVTTLDERQALRAELEGKLGVLKGQIQELEQARGAVQMEDYSQIDDSIAGLRREQKALEEQIKRTGVGTTGRNIGSAVGSVLGGIGGAVLGTKALPGVGTVKGGVAGSAVGAGVGSALGTMADLKRAEPVTEDEASGLILRGAVEDVIWDVAGSALFVGGGKLWAMKMKPGLKERIGRVLEKAAVDKRVGYAAAERDTAVKEFFNPRSRVPGKEAGEDAMAAAAKEKAVAELSERSRGFIPTKGQITGEPSMGERAARSLQPATFDAQQEALERSAKGMREELTNPLEQPSREQIGLFIQKKAEKTVEAVKRRTAPTFEAARRVGVETDMSPVIARIEAALAEDAGSAKRLLKPAERTDLQNMLRDLTSKQEDFVEILGPDGKALPRDPSVRMAVGDAFNFVSGNKSKLRDVSAVDVPSRQYEKLLGEINELADTQALDAINGVGGKSLRDALLKARDDYRGVMGAVYDGAVQQALRRNPEDVGRLFWQRGNVTEVKQMQELLRIGLAEKALTQEQVRSMNESMLRGFLQDAVPDLAKASRWTETLKADPARAETFRTLVAQPGMSKIEEGMRVLEQAARIAGVRHNDIAYAGSGMISNLPVRMAIGGTLGYVGTKAMALFGTVEGITKVMSTALTRGDTGAWRNLMIFLRASSTDSPKAMSAARPAAVALIKYIKDLGDPELEAQFDFGEEQQEEKQ